jgi:CheY-like chemotaxis protein
MPKATSILAVCDDLFFVVKINDIARRCGLRPQYVKSAAELLERAGAEKPLMIIVDLNAKGLDAVDLISQVRAEAALKGVSVMAFVSHVEADLKVRAQNAGATMVMARSAFSANLPQIFKRHSGSL